jgi:hypothetical protein
MGQRARPSAWLGESYDPAGAGMTDARTTQTPARVERMSSAPRPPVPERRVGSRLPAAFTSVLWNVTVLCIALGAWQLLTLVLNSRFFPGPIAILRAFIELAVNGDTGGHTLLDHSVASV